MRPGHSVRPKIRPMASETDLITILRCFLSFKTVLTSRNIIVFKIFCTGKKTAIRVVHALWYLVPLAELIWPEVEQCSWRLRHQPQAVTRISRI